MKSIEELKAIKAKMQAEIETRSAVSDSDVKIVVGMATCGIAAGARPVLNAFLDAAQKAGLKNVKVLQAGCFGTCKAEPMAEVHIPCKDKVIYGRLTPDAARKIVAEHIMGGNIVAEYVVKG